MKQQHKNRQLVDKFTIRSSKCGEIKLIAGVDPNPPDPYPNVFSIFAWSPKIEIQESHARLRVYGSLNDMTRLGVLMNVASRFWVDRYDKGEPYSEERISDFVTEYRKIKKSLKRLLPKQKFPE